MEQPVGGSGENAAHERSSQPPPSVGVTGHTHKIATFTDEGQHIINHQHRAGVVRAEDGHDGCPGFCHAGANGVDHAAAQLVVHGPQSRVAWLRLFDDRKASVIRRVVDHQHLMGGLDGHLQDAEQDPQVHFLIPHRQKDRQGWQLGAGHLRQRRSAQSTTLGSGSGTMNFPR